MKKILAIIVITRPINVIITFAVVVVSSIICSGSFNITNIIFLAGVSASLVTAGGNIINDIFDKDIDKINRPKRVIPSGRINLHNAKILYRVVSFTAILISYYISSAAIIIVIVTIILLYFYSLKLKRIPLLGNLVIACCTALAFIYGGIAVDNLKEAIIPAIFAFLVNLIREIVKDIEDIEGDVKNGINTFPVKYGIKAGKDLLIALVVLLLLTTLVPFIFKIYNIEYLIIVLFSVDVLLVYFLKVIFSETFTKKISQLSLLLKISMVFGLIAIYAG